MSATNAQLYGLLEEAKLASDDVTKTDCLLALAGDDDARDRVARQHLSEYEGPGLWGEVDLAAPMHRRELAALLVLRDRSYPMRGSMMLEAAQRLHPALWRTGPAGTTVLYLLSESDRVTVEAGMYQLTAEGRAEATAAEARLAKVRL